MTVWQEVSIDERPVAVTHRRLTLPALSLPISVVALVVAIGAHPPTSASSTTATSNPPIVAGPAATESQPVSDAAGTTAARIVACYRTVGRWPC